MKEEFVKSMPKYKRFFIVISLIFLYFIVWLVFGALYRHEANKTGGVAFVFQEDIRLQVLSKKFKGLIKFPEPSIPLETRAPATYASVSEAKTDDIPDKVVKSLILAYLEKPEISDTEITEYLYPRVFLVRPGELNKKPDGQPHKPDWTTGEPIGSIWARFYVAMFWTQGITHYETVEYANDLDADSMGKQGDYRIKLLLYQCKNNKPKEDLYHRSPWSFIRKTDAGCDLIHEYILPCVEPKNLEEERLVLTIKPLILPIDKLEFSLSYSMVFLDGSVAKLFNVLKGNYEYPWPDFLYFSAVTITTLGYGDILPNNSYIRTLVMIETFTGIVIIGGLVTFLFSGKNGGEKLNGRPKTGKK